MPSVCFLSELSLSAPEEFRAVSPRVAGRARVVRNVNIHATKALHAMINIYSLTSYMDDSISLLGEQQLQEN